MLLDATAEQRELSRGYIEQLWSVLAIHKVSGMEWMERAEPILSGRPQLDYPNTTVRFFLGEREHNPAIVETGMAYFEVIRPKHKEMYIVKNTGHHIFATHEGVKALVASIKQVAGP